MGAPWVRGWGDTLTVGIGLVQVGWGSFGGVTLGPGDLVEILCRWAGVPDIQLMSVLVGGK